MVSVFVSLTQFSLEKEISATGRCCLKHHLWQKIEISMLDFSPNTQLTLHRTNIIDFLPGKSVASRMQRVLLQLVKYGLWRRSADADEDGGVLTHKTGTGVRTGGFGPLTPFQTQVRPLPRSRRGLQPKTRSRHFTTLSLHGL